MQTQIQNFITQSRNEFLEFGRLFLEQLCNGELIASIAHKDVEKLAKVFRLLLEIYESEQEEKKPEALTAILEAFGQSGDEDDENE